MLRGLAGRSPGARLWDSHPLRDSPLHFLAHPGAEDPKDQVADGRLLS